MSEGEEAVRDVRDFLDKAKPDLVITDVPTSTLKLFKELANSDEFKCGKNKGGHYGYTLKFLLDFYLGRINDGLDEVNARVDELYEKLGEQKTQPEEKKIKLCNGKELNIGG